MTKHDYQAAAEYFALHGGEIPNGIHRSTMAALRAAAARQEQEEAVERGEAIRVRSGGKFLRSGELLRIGVGQPLVAYGINPDDESCDFVLSAIVRLPRPQEIEAEVE